jgi:glycosyltransferase involved in cell wall biosynthesis
VLLRRSEVVVPSLTLHHVARTRWKISPERLHYIPNGINCARFAGIVNESARFRASDAVPMVGTVAALRPEKNFARLLRAFALVCRERPCNLTIVGDGPERSNVEALAAALGITDRVTLSGHIADPAALYHDFDVFVLASDTEQMPYTVLEAMAAGLPVVVTDVGDIRAMVAEQNKQFVVDRDDRKIAAKLRCVLQDRALARQAGTANAKRARERFDQSVMFGAFAKLYHLLAMSDAGHIGMLP